MFSIGDAHYISYFIGLSITRQSLPSQNDFSLCRRFNLFILSSKIINSNSLDAISYADYFCHCSSFFHVVYNNQHFKSMMQCTSSHRIRAKKRYKFTTVNILSQRASAFAILLAVPCQSFDQAIPNSAVIVRHSLTWHLPSTVTQFLGQRTPAARESLHKRLCDDTVGA